MQLVLAPPACTTYRGVVLQGQPRHGPGFLYVRKIPAAKRNLTPVRSCLSGQNHILQEIV